MTDVTNTEGSDTLRGVMIAALVLIAVFGAYEFASAQAGQAPTTAAGQALARGAGASATASGGKMAGAAGSSPACACCSGAASNKGGVTGPRTEGVAALEGGVQRIAVDVGTIYTPNALKLKAGVPAEITFSQAQGCTQIVESADLGFSEDVSAGSKTVKLQGLQPGTYAFSCGMQMVFGQIVVE